MRKFLLAAAASTALSTAANACNTWDIGTAFLEYQTAEMLMTSAADGIAATTRLGRKFTAVLSHCKRGEIISIPRMYVRQYCDYDKHVENEGNGMVSCVKR